MYNASIVQPGSFLIEQPEFLDSPLNAHAEYKIRGSDEIIDEVDVNIENK